MQNYLIDIDGTIGEDIPNEEWQRFPFAKVYDYAVKWVNEKYKERDKEGKRVNRITFFTSREEKTRYMTIEWLIKNGFKFDGLLMEKPRGGNYIWYDNLPVVAIHLPGGFRDETEEDYSI